MYENGSSRFLRSLKAKSATPRLPRHCPFRITIRSAATKRFPLIIQAFPSANAQFNLDLASPQVNVQGNDRKPLLLCLDLQADDFLLVQKQAFRSVRIVVESIPVFVCRNAESLQEHLSGIDSREAPAEAYMSCAEALHFGTFELYTGLYPFQDRVTM